LKKIYWNGRSGSMNIIDKLRFKLLMMKRVKAFTMSLQKGLPFSEARKITDEKYPASEEYREYEKGLKGKKT
jgi:hypothetical protein